MSNVIREGTIDIRVRYAECDPMGVAHHTAYPVWLEIGRTELLRETGVTYRELEDAGVLLAVIDLSVAYKRPARYDDLLQLTTTWVDSGHVKIKHRYALHRQDELLVTAETTLACLDREGRPQALPELLSRC
ncbi:MAG: acyl-CoA thioesterase [Phycisphaerales bacterium]|nr:acyl-CoA thioesterase [Phycisphaerales bacterium]